MTKPPRGHHRHNRKRKAKPRPITPERQALIDRLTAERFRPWPPPRYDDPTDTWGGGW